MTEKIVFGFDKTGDGIMVTSSTVESFYTHTHLYNELLVYEPFKGHITVNGENIPIDSDTVLLVTASDFHSTSVIDCTDSKYLKIAFTNEAVSPAFSERLAGPVLLPGCRSCSLLYMLLDKLKEAEGESKGIILNALLLELFEMGAYVGSTHKKGTEVMVLRAVEAVNKTFTERITLLSVSSALGITPQYLSSVFSRYMGVSFSEYLRDKRLRYAAGLLLENKYNVTEICYKCGFENLSHFLRSFKKRYGVSPKKYQKEGRGL